VLGIPQIRHKTRTKLPQKPLISLFFLFLAQPGPSARPHGRPSLP